MPWRELPLPKNKERWRELNRLTVRRSRFLVDEGLGVGVANVIRGFGYNTIFGPDLGLGGKSDEDVYGFAWRSERILLTHDKDFLDDREFPFNRNPGVIVLPGEEGEEVPLARAIGSMLNIFGTHGRIFPNAKIVIDSNNVWYIKNYRKADGFVEHSRLMFKNGRVFRWDS
jgi:predicted nuclease of predicted toxin-antitoxin system